MNMLKNILKGLFITALIYLIFFCFLYSIYRKEFNYYKSNEENINRMIESFNNKNEDKFYYELNELLKKGELNE